MNNIKLLSTLTLAFSVTLAGAQEVSAPSDVGDAVALLAQRGAVYGVSNSTALSRDEAARLLFRLLRNGVLTAPTVQNDGVVSAALDALAPELVVLRLTEGPSGDPAVRAVEDRLARLAGNAAVKAAPAVPTSTSSPDLARLADRLEALETREATRSDLFGTPAARVASTPAPTPAPRRAPYVDLAVTPSGEGLQVSATLGFDALLGTVGGRATGSYRTNSGEITVGAALTKRFGGGELAPYVGLGGGVTRTEANAPLGGHLNGFAGLDARLGGLSVFGEVGGTYAFDGQPMKTTSRVGLKFRL